MHHLLRGQAAALRLRLRHRQLRGQPHQLRVVLLRGRQCRIHGAARAQLRRQRGDDPAQPVLIILQQAGQRIHLRQQAFPLLWRHPAHRHEVPRVPGGQLVPEPAGIRHAPADDFAHVQPEGQRGLHQSAEPLAHDLRPIPEGVPAEVVEGHAPAIVTLPPGGKEVDGARRGQPFGHAGLLMPLLRRQVRALGQAQRIHRGAQAVLRPLAQHGLGRCQLMLLPAEVGQQHHRRHLRLWKALPHKLRQGCQPRRAHAAHGRAHQRHPHGLPRPGRVLQGSQLLRQRAGGPGIPAAHEARQQHRRRVRPALEAVPQGGLRRVRREQRVQQQPILLRSRQRAQGGRRLRQLSGPHPQPQPRAEGGNLPPLRPQRPKQGIVLLPGGQRGRIGLGVRQHQVDFRQLRRPRQRAAAQGPQHLPARAAHGHDAALHSFTPCMKKARSPVPSGPPRPLRSA